MIYKNININDIRKQIKKEQTKGRYIHTLGVAYTAASLAMKYDVNVEQAFLAGILHDCAKCLPDQEIISECKKYNIEITDMEAANPNLLHSKLGGYYVKTKYFIDEIDIINAVIYHTTGKPEMTMLEKIIYVADFIEPNRVKASNLAEVRKISFENIDFAVYIIAKSVLEYLKDKNCLIDETTVQTLKYYEKLINIEGKGE